MKYVIHMAWAYTLVCLASACDGGRRESDQTIFTKEVALDKPEDYGATDTLAQAAPPQAPTPKEETTTVVKTDWDKKIVKTATLQAEVKDFPAFSKSLAQEVKDLGGYISSEQQNPSEYRVENVVTIKVPVGLFDKAVETLLKETKQVDTRQISSEDVSREYVDSKSRLEAKKQVRLRYLDLLKSAKNMNDIIEVQKEINSIQEEIELVSGRMDYLAHASVLSTIHFTYYQVLNASNANRGTPGYIEQLKNSFANGWYWLGELLLGIVAIWPLVLLLVLIVVLIRKKGVLRTR